MFNIFKTDFIYHQRINNYEEINDKILNRISELDGTEGRTWTYSKCKTSYHSGDNSFLSDSYLLDNILWEPYDKMLDEDRNVIPFHDNTRPKASHITDIWYNIYTKGEYQEVHNHAIPDKNVDGDIYSCSFCFIYIAELPLGEKNTTVFTRTQPMLGSFTANRDNIATSEIDEIGVGSVIIFPSHLDHYVLPFWSDGRRVTVSGNISTSYSSN